MGKIAALAAALLGALVVTGVAAADEAKTSIRASLFLDLTAPRAQSRDVAFQESLRGADLPPVRQGVGEVQDDGSVRYGNVTVTVRNPCPPGHDKAEMLPGRRSK